MGRYIIRRTGAAITTLIAASIVIFSFIHLIPGDPVYVMLGDGATPDQVAALRNRLGLDEPVVVQYLIWAGNALSGDLGQSVFFETPVTRVIADGAETSILLALITMVWIVGFGIPVGVLAAIRQGRWIDQGLSGLAMLLAWRRRDSRLARTGSIGLGLLAAALANLLFWPHHLCLLLLTLGPLCAVGMRDTKMRAGLIAIGLVMALCYVPLLDRFAPFDWMAILGTPTLGVLAVFALVFIHFMRRSIADNDDTPILRAHEETSTGNSVA